MKFFTAKSKVTTAAQELRWLWETHREFVILFEDEYHDIFRCLIFFLKFKTSINMLRVLTRQQHLANLTLLASVANVESDFSEPAEIFN